MMETMDITYALSTDANCVLIYLKNYPNDFMTETEIARRADGRHRFMDDPYWAHFALIELTDFKYVETDGSGRFRLKTTVAATASPKKPGAKFLSPQMREILQQSGKGFDLSVYA